MDLRRRFHKAVLLGWSLQRGVHLALLEPPEGSAPRCSLELLENPSANLGQFCNTRRTGLEDDVIFGGWDAWTNTNTPQRQQVE
jgi:hypothetical protein